MALLCCSEVKVSHELHQKADFYSPAMCPYSLTASSALKQQKPKCSIAAPCDELGTSEEEEAAIFLRQSKQTLESLSGVGGRGRKLGFL